MCASGDIPAHWPGPATVELYAEFFANDPPARMTMQVPLPRGLLISIGCTAVTDT
jgi:2-iminobutanoate/2-iminopropanoate deaminase